MTHIDEGTIHAWLDDALAPDEAARVERHVRECAECAAAVAEARGLIAASSRILSALDDVVGGVIPRAAREADGDGGAAPLRLRLRRPWWQRPQFAAAAGIAFIAVAASVVARRGGVGSVADYSMERAPASEAPLGAAPDATPSPAVAADSSAIASGVAASGVAAKQTVPAEQDVAAEQKVAGAARDKVAAEREAPVDAATRERSAADNRAVAGRAAPSAAPSPKALSAEGAAATRQAVPPAPSAPPAAEARAAGGTTRPADSTSAQRKLAMDPDAITRSEKARVLGERTLRLEAVVTTGAAEARTDARRDYTTVQGIVGCYRLQRRVPALDAGVTEIVALEATESGTHEGDVLRVARLIGAAPEANTLWRWTLSARGDVALVRVQGKAHARFPLALRLAAQTGETSIATRIDCPAR
ncbi:MAG: zf-HC2 domain-containing protein [Gemmatimonadota bacterium]